MTRTREPDELRNAVRDRYAAIAEAARASAGKTGCGCGCGKDPGELLTLFDYGEINAGIVEGADLGLGCGVPTRYAALQPGEVVLDLGSGGGLDVFVAAAEVGPEGSVIGVDMTPDMVELARRNAEQGGYQNVEFRLGEIEHLPLADASVDVVISNCVINLAPDKAAVFGEVARVLKPGGRFCLSDMVSYGTMPPEIRDDIRAYTGCIAGTVEREAYLGLLVDAGLREVMVVEEQPVAPYDGPEWGIVSATITGRK